MSNYLNDKPSFYEPRVVQYSGSHPVMTDVYKETKTKHVNIDTRFRDDYYFASTSGCQTTLVNYEITLPERITNVKSIEVERVDLPLTFYNISSAANNNSIQLIFNSATTPIYKTITIPDSYYSFTTFSTAINLALGASGLNVPLVYSYSSDVSFSNFVFTPSVTYTTLQMVFSVDNTGNFNKYELRSRLGWLLGFRLANYTFPTTGVGVASTLTGTAIPDFWGFKYLYLAVEEFNNASHQDTFVAYLPRGLANRSILARISVNHQLAFGSVQNCSDSNGLLVSDVRTYNSATDLMKLGIQLVNEFGNPISLNNMDFAISLKIRYSP